MFEALLAQLARAFDAAAVPYMVIGGQAVLFYGEPRFTKDVDLTLGVGPEAVDLVMETCAKAGLRVLTMNPSEFVNRTMVLPCQAIEDGTRVDIVFSTSVFERESVAEAATFFVDQTPVRVASLPTLMVHKTIAGRPRDLEDLRALAARHPALDRSSVERKLQEFSDALGEDFVERFRVAVRR